MDSRFVRQAALIAIAPVLCSCAAAMKKTAAFANPTDDLRPILAATAATLRPQATQPVWQQVIGAGDVREIALLPGNRVLLLARAARPIDDSKSKPEDIAGDGEARLYDGMSGELLWRAASVDWRHSVVMTDPLVLRHMPSSDDRKVKTSYIAIDDATGGKKWRREFGAFHTFTASKGGRTVYVGERIDSMQSRVLAIDSDRDTVRWTLTLDGKFLPRIFVTSPDWLLLSRDTLRVVSASDGRVRHHLGAVIPRHVIEAPSRVGTIVIGANGEVMHLGANGQLLWTVPALSLKGAAIEGFAFDDRRLFLVLFAGAQEWHVVAIQLSDGKELWQRAARGRPVSTPIVADSLLFVSAATGDSTAMYAFGVRDGRAVRQVLLPAQRRATISDSAMKATKIPGGFKVPCPEVDGMDASLLPDILVKYPEHILIMQETAVGAISSRTGQVLWWHRIEHPEPTRACGRYNTLTALAYAEDARKPGAAARLAGGLEAGAASLAASNAANSQARTAAFEQKRAMGTATSLDYRAQATHLQMERDFALANTSIAIISAGAAIGAAIGEAIFWGEIFPNRLDRIQRVNDQAVAAHIGALNGDYFIRAFARGARTGKGEASWYMCRSFKHGMQRTCDGFEGRSGVLVVDARTGSWSEITTGPWESGIDEQALNLQMPLMLESRPLLIAAAPGLDVANWGSARVVYRMQTAPQSLLAYDISKLPLRPAAEYAKRSVTLRGTAKPLYAKVAEIKNGATTTDELTQWFGAPTLQVGSSWTWESLVEEGGRVRYERVQCEVAGQKVASCLTGVPK